MDPAAPFVLLDDARPGGAGARLFSGVARQLAARTPAAVREVTRFVAAARAEGLAVAGYLSFEAGHALEPRLQPLAAPAPEGAPPLAWFAAFAESRVVEAAALLPAAAGAWAGAPVPEIGCDDYRVRFDRVKALIAAGDIYQANLTFRARVPFAGSPLALYAGLRRAAAGWGGIVFDGSHWLLSLSPELFVAVDAQGNITARPMKGTAARHPDPADDARAAAALARDPKERAENLMIVDLFRNDLSRVAEPGSVAVPALFEIESYPTVHQLTSTVTARKAAGVESVALALFPSGSVTGAPKIRATEVIAAIEPSRRGPYTGSIGGWTDAGECFNVAIRTLVIREGERHATLGLGSGVVADSTADAEWRECLAKGRFVTDGQPPFDLIETMRFDPIEGLCDLERHLARMKASADRFGFAFDRHDTRNELQAATFRLRTMKRVRLRLAASGAVAIVVHDLPAAAAEPVAVALTTLPVDPADFRLAHKTSNRGFYDDARHQAGTFEVVFVRADGLLTEGSFTSLFAERDGVLVTPPLALGLLPGVLRDRLIAEGRAVEGELRAADLTQGFCVGNALRGLIHARLTAAAG